MEYILNLIDLIVYYVVILGWIVGILILILLVTIVPIIEIINNLREYTYTLQEWDYSHSYYGRVYEIVLKKKNYFRTSYIKKYIRYNHRLDNLQRNQIPFRIKENGAYLSIFLKDKDNQYPDYIFIIV